MKYQLLFVLFAFLFSCSSSKNHVQGWIETTVPDQFGNMDGYKALEVKGYDLSKNLNEAIVQYYVTQDMISGGYKPVFVITLDGTTSSDTVIIETPEGEIHEFDCYDGIIFNVDFNSNDIQRIVPLFKNEYLRITQGGKQFSVKCEGFYEL